MKVNSFKIKTIIAAFILFFTQCLFAQNERILYAGLVNSKGYVAGAKLSPSGLYRFSGDTTWVHIGWNHPRVNGIAFAPTHPQVIFLAGGNGVLRSLDSGKSWRIATGWEVTEVQDIAVDPISPHNVYIATPYGIWRSTDQGETWIESNNGLSQKYTQTIEVDRTHSGRVFAGTQGGLFLSENGAHSWSLSTARDIPVHDIQQSAVEPDLWMMGTEQNGVFISKNGGKEWRKAKGNIALASIYAVALNHFDTKIMAASGWDTGVFLTKDSGTTWQQHMTGLPTPHIYEVIFDYNHAGEIWAATVEKGIYKSNDFGHSWSYCGMFGAIVFDMKFQIK
ncbi:MAG: WD40/YVTN/BNR-like repeat-containing protein [bacterium]